jgi:hypothetical protein
VFDSETVRISALFIKSLALSPKPWKFSTKGIVDTPSYESGIYNIYSLLSPFRNMD